MSETSQGYISKHKKRRIKAALGDTPGPMISREVKDWEVVLTTSDYDKANEERLGLQAGFDKSPAVEGVFNPQVKVKKSASGEFTVRVAKGTRVIKFIDYAKAAAMHKPEAASILA
jgi:hypothetical protein